MAPDPALGRAAAGAHTLPFGCHPRLTASEFAWVAALQGTYYRRVAGRETLRLTLEDHREGVWFLKRHHGVGWREIFKNLIQGRLPVLGAGTEFRAIERLHAIGVPTLVVAGFGQGGRSPARRFSYLLTEELPATCSLEDLCAAWGERAAWPPARRLLQRRLLGRLAWTLASMHAHGINHRDCYLCHFHVPDRLAGDEPLHPDTPVTVIDLHRAQLRRRVPRRWRIKDLGGLYYSALDSGLTRRDCLRFIARYQRHYQALTGGPGEAPPLRQILRQDGRFWRRVAANAAFMYQKRFGRRARLPLGSTAQPAESLSEALWALPVAPVDAPNRRGAGWSEAGWLAGNALPDELAGIAAGMERVFVKRQQAYLTRGPWPWSRELTLAREYRTLLRAGRQGLAVPRPLYFGQGRSASGEPRALLMVAELAGYRDLPGCLDQAVAPAVRRGLWRALGRAVATLHRQGMLHNCLYPKHIFMKRSPAGDGWQVTFIDLEKARWLRPLPGRDKRLAKRDLGTLWRRLRGERVTRTQALRCYLAYHGAQRLSPRLKASLRRLWLAGGS